MLLTPYLSQEELQKLLINIWSWLRFAVIIIHNLYCIPIYLFLNWFLLLPIYYLNENYYKKLENCLYNWLLYIVSSWSYGANIEIHEFGDDIYQLNEIDKNVRLLIVANHQSTADVPLMMQSFTSRSKYILLWIMDVVFKYTNFGLVSITHGDYFLKTKSHKTGHILDHCCSDYNRDKNAIVLFPEGGFRHKRLQSSNKFAAKHNLPALFHVTYPRFGAYNEIMSPEVGITHVVDLTIIYEDIQNPLSIIDIARGNHKSRVIFNYRIFDVKNTDNIRTEEWLNNRWKEKEVFIQKYYSDSRLLIKSLKELTVVSLNWIKVLSIHFFHLSLFFFLFIIYKQFKQQFVY